MFELIPFGRRNLSYDPFREFEEMERNFFGNTRSIGFRTDIKEEEKNYILEAELPGFDKKDIETYIEDNNLYISAERNYENNESDKNGNYIRRERSYGSFSRCFDLTGVDAEKISAEYKDGILKLTLPKLEKELPKSRKLEIM